MFRGSLTRGVFNQAQLRTTAPTVSHRSILTQRQSTLLKAPQPNSSFSSRVIPATTHLTPTILHTLRHNTSQYSRRLLILQAGWLGGWFGSSNDANSPDTESIVNNIAAKLAQVTISAKDDRFHKHYHRLSKSDNRPGAFFDETVDFSMTQGPPPPEYSSEIKDKYNMPIHNIFRYCRDDRLHERFEVHYTPTDVHANINNYRTFIEKERFYIMKDSFELAAVRESLLDHLISLHHILGLSIEGEEHYRALLANDIRTKLQQEKIQQFESWADSEPDLADKLTDDEISVKIAVSDDEIEREMDINKRNDFIIKYLKPEEKPEDNELLQKLTERKAITIQPLADFRSTLPPPIVEYIELVQVSVKNSFSSCQELQVALDGLAASVATFDELANDAHEREKYYDEADLLICQSALITGTRQIVRNLLHHADDTLTKFETFFNADRTKYLFDAVYQPDAKRENYDMNPFFPHYDALCTAEDAVNEFHTRALIGDDNTNLSEADIARKNKTIDDFNLQATLQQIQRYNDEYRHLAHNPQRLADSFPDPPFFAVDEGRIHEALRRFAVMENDPSKVYAPTSYPFTYLTHNWEKSGFVPSIYEEALELDEEDPYPSPTDNYIPPTDRLGILSPLGIDPDEDLKVLQHAERTRIKQEEAELAQNGGRGVSKNFTPYGEDITPFAYQNLGTSDNQEFRLYQLDPELIEQQQRQHQLDSSQYTTEMYDRQRHLEEQYNDAHAPPIYKQKGPNSLDKYSDRENRVDRKKLFPSHPSGTKPPAQKDAVDDNNEFDVRTFQQQQQQQYLQQFGEGYYEDVDDEPLFDEDGRYITPEQLAQMRYQQEYEEMLSQGHQIKEFWGDEIDEYDMFGEYDEDDEEDDDNQIMSSSSLMSRFKQIF